MKKHLLRVVGKHNLTFEEYGTLLAQVEACVNSRPLAPLSDDPNDLSALTPGHFLVGESLVNMQEHQPLNDAQPAYLKRWELVQQMHQSLWRRWHDENITSLITRSKWKVVSRNFQTNDLVIIKENNLPPSHWQMGRIIEILPSKDGLTRAVRVKTALGEYVRLIVKMELLFPSNECPTALDGELLNESNNSPKAGVIRQPTIKLTRLSTRKHKNQTGSTDSN